MKHFVQRLEEYSENPEAKATGAVQWLAIALCIMKGLWCVILSVQWESGPVGTSCNQLYYFVMQICTC